MSDGQANTICSLSYGWANNALGQDPCEVASALITQCNGAPFPPLADGASYPPPKLPQDGCLCSRIEYYLVSACADCQDGKYTTWANWNASCNTTFNLPTADTQVPQWALDLQNVNAPTYNRTLAQQLAVAASISSSASSNVPPQTDTPHVDAVSHSAPSTRIAIIAGSTIGGVVLLALLAALVLFWVKCRRRSRMAPSAAYKAAAAHGRESPFPFRSESRYGNYGESPSVPTSSLPEKTSFGSSQRSAFDPYALVSTEPLSYHNVQHEDYDIQQHQFEEIR